MAKPVMYLFVNKGLGMSTGKTAAQVAHAAVEAYRISAPSITDEWHKGGHYTKLVMECRDTEHLLVVERYLNDRGYNTVLIIDEGRTEIEPHTPTAVGVEIVDKSDPHTLASFESFKTYKDTEGKIPIGATIRGPGDNFPKRVAIPLTWDTDSIWLSEVPFDKPKLRWYHKTLGPWVFPKAHGVLDK